MQLPTRTLGQDGPDITRVGIGTAPMGSSPEWSVYWGPQDETDAIRAIETAVDLGINWIDTAPFYGWGRAEQITGKALNGKRDRVYIFTKCGTIRTPDGHWIEDLSPASVRNELEASLRNLRTDYVDMLQFHDPDPKTPIEESWAALHTLIREGKVRYGGLSNHPIELIARAMRIGPVTATQYQYSLLHADIERDILPFARQSGIGVLAWSPLASGFLTDGFDLDALDPADFRRRHPLAQEPGYTRLRRLRDSLGSIARRQNKTLSELAIAWVLRQPALTGAIMGIRNEREARAMIGGLDWELSAEDLNAIEAARALWT
ncbi:MAG TPA: aldo/keto reductase [Ktedonobacterales bacterium]